MLVNMMNMTRTTDMTIMLTSPVSVNQGLLYIHKTCAMSTMDMRPLCDDTYEVLGQRCGPICLCRQLQTSSIVCESKVSDRVDRQSISQRTEGRHQEEGLAVVQQQIHQAHRMVAGPHNQHRRGCHRHNHHHN